MLKNSGQRPAAAIDIGGRRAKIQQPMHETYAWLGSATFITCGRRADVRCHPLLRRISHDHRYADRTPALSIDSAGARRRMPRRHSLVRAALDDGLLPDADDDAIRLEPRNFRARHRHPESRLGHRPAVRRHPRRQVRHRPRADRRRPALRARACADGLHHRPDRPPVDRRCADRARHRRLGVRAGDLGLRAAAARRYARRRVRRRHCRRIGGAVHLRDQSVPERSAKPSATGPTGCWSRASSSAASRSRSSPSICRPTSPTSAFRRYTAATPSD